MATLLRFDSRLARLRDMITALRPGVAAVLFAALALAAMPLGPNAALAVGHLTESESRQMRAGEVPKRIALGIVSGIADDSAQAMAALVLEEAASHFGEPVPGDAPHAIIAALSPQRGQTGDATTPPHRDTGLDPSRPARQFARGPPGA